MQKVKKLNRIKTSRYTSSCRVKALFILIFMIIFPMILNTHLYSTFNREIDDGVDFPDQELDIKVSSYKPPTAFYFNFCKNITVDNTKVSGSGSHVDFPVLINISDTDLRYDVQPDGDDIAFAIGNSWLDHEIELFNQEYSATHALLTAWVRIPSLSTSVDTIVTMYYGNSTMSSQENPEGVWDANYKGVYHLHDDFLDSTSNNRDGTNTGSVDATGRIGDGQDFEALGGTGTDNINIGTWSVSGTHITIQAWVKLESVTVGDARILSKNSGIGDGTEDHVWMLGTEISPNRLRGRIKTGTSDSTGTSTVVATSGDLSIDTWYLTTLIYEAPNIRFVLDGNTVGSFSKTGSLRINNWPITIGNNPTIDKALDGIIDEVRISSTLRSNDWLLTEYYNQNDPNTFYTIGGEQPVSTQPPNAGYFNYYKIITIDHAQVSGAGSHVNFPILISLIDDDLRHDVQTDGDDIAFSTNGKWLDHEIELFNQTYSVTQAHLTAWVRIPYLYTNIDTNITMYYSNMSMGSRQDPSGVWDSNYVGVWHLNDDPKGTSLDIKDSTTPYSDGTSNYMTSSDQVPGKIGGSLDFDGSNDYINIINTPELQITGEITIQLWFKTNLVKNDYLINKMGGDGQRGWDLSFDDDAGLAPDGWIDFRLNDDGWDPGSSVPEKKVNAGQWYQAVGIYKPNDYLKLFLNGSMVSNNTFGIPPSMFDPLLPVRIAERADGSSTNYNGTIDEVRISQIARSNDWIATEYNNQFDPSSFYSIGSEQEAKLFVYLEAQINAVDLYDNLISNVNISMFQNGELEQSEITTNGSVLFSEILSGEYNFTVKIISFLDNNTELVNITTLPILIDKGFQNIDLICNVSTNFFELKDIDGNPVESGWIIVGKNAATFQKCSINSTGGAMFQWLNITPYNYNYTVYYQNNNYLPNIITLATGNITVVNFLVPIQVNLTTIEFTVLTSGAINTPISGAKIKLKNNGTGVSIVNLTTDSDGKATLRWLNSSGIDGNNYSLQIEFFGKIFKVNSTALGAPDKSEINFTVSNQESIDLRITINLNEYQTELLSLNPTDYITIEWGTILKLRMLFNVTKDGGANLLLGPKFADSMTYQLLLEGSPVLAESFLKEGINEGRHHVSIDTKLLESDKNYIISISASKSGFSPPSDLIIQLNVLNNELELNQSENDDTVQSVYWSDFANMTVNPYGKISEDFTAETRIFLDSNNMFEFSIPDISDAWNLSRIIFNVNNVKFEEDEGDINLNITDDFGTTHIFNSGNSNYYYYSPTANNGSWSNLEVILDKGSKKDNNNFNFTIDGTFTNTIDVTADVYFIRDNVNIQYSKFNVSDSLTLFTEAEGWTIKNITFDIYNCYNTSTWQKIDLTTPTNINITTNEGFKYPLDLGHDNGTGFLTIDDHRIYPLNNKFKFAVEGGINVTFDVMINVEYIQEFYENQYLETLNTTIVENNLTHGEKFIVKVMDSDDNNKTNVNLWIRSINNLTNYFLPSELAMNLTIGGATYNITDYNRGTGLFSLDNISKEILHQASLSMLLAVNFSLFLKIEHSRNVYYETIGPVSYNVIEAPYIFGNVQYNEELKYYLQTINTSRIDVHEYTIRFSILKDHYVSASKDLGLIVLNRPTLLNGSTDIFRKFEQVYAMESSNFTFLYVDYLTSQPITNLKQQSYLWEYYDDQRQILKSGQGDLTTVDNSYVLDLNTERLTLGEYLIVIMLDKDNYDFKNGLISLSILERPTLVNETSQLDTIQSSIYVGQELNFTYSYVDFRTNTSITDLRNQTYTWKQLDNLGFTIGSGQDNLTLNAENFYVLDFDTEKRNMGDYVLEIILNKDNYTSKTNTILLTILERPTLVNGVSDLPPILETIYEGEEKFFIFSYVDTIASANITNLDHQFYTWKKLDREGLTVDSGQDYLILDTNNLYVLDFDTELKSSGSYELNVTINKENYTVKTATIFLTINKRLIDFAISENFQDYQINVVKGKPILIELNLTDITRNNSFLTGITVVLSIGGLELQFDEISNGTYRLVFSTSSIDAFFSSKTLRGTVNISKDKYHSLEFSITIVVEMEEILPGIPTSYFILALSIILPVVGSIVAYRTYKHVMIPTFVKKVRSMRKAIEGGKGVSESDLYPDKEVFIGELTGSGWEKLGLSMSEIFGIKIEKETKDLQLIKKISERTRRHDQKPLGLILMKWDEKIGTELYAKYPEDLSISEKSLMQVYSTHEYSGEKGVITLTAESLNILSYYTGQEEGYYLLLFLNLDDDPDVYEGGMPDILRIILENLKDDSYLQLIPQLFERLSVYPSLSDEEILALHYQNSIKRTIINILREDGVITRSELMIWLKDKHIEGFFDLEAILSDLIKMDILKVGSIKGIPSELIFLTKDLFMLRTPPVKLLEDPVSHGLPTQFIKEYPQIIKEFFQDYQPTEEDNIKFIEALINPQVYEMFRLLRVSIATRQDLEKLRKKGVDDIYGVLKILWDNKMIKVFHDEKKNEYYALLTDFYIDFIFPKYLLKIVKTAYEQKSKIDKVLLEYLRILEETYKESKSKK